MKDKKRISEIIRLILTEVIYDSETNGHGCVCYATSYLEYSDVISNGEKYFIDRSLAYYFCDNDDPDVSVYFLDDRWSLNEDRLTLRFLCVYFLEQILKDEIKKAWE